jgi:hypothetical protein
MGHSITNQVSFGQCHLSQCSCGRGALKLRDKVILLSSMEVKEMSRIFSSLAEKAVPGASPLVSKLNGLMGMSGWEDFSIPQ